jgi:predicted peptidase
VKRRRLFRLIHLHILGGLTLIASVVAALVALPGVATLNPRQRATSAFKAALLDDGPLDYGAHLGPIDLPAEDTLKGFSTRAFIDADGDSMTFYLYAPPIARTNPTAKLPLTLILIGSGESASTTATPDLNRARVLDDSYVNLWTSAAVQSKWPGYVLAPQVVAPTRWVNVPGNTGSYQLATQPSTALALVKDILDETIREAGATLDTKRIYITGISMGAYGVWDAIERWPQTFAAAAPVAGAGDPSRAAALTDLPIWDFHGSGDDQVPISGSTDMIQAIRAAGGHPKFTLIPSKTHDIWMQAYDYPDFLPWLYAQRA